MTYLPERDTQNMVSGWELARYLETANVLVFDVRPKEEYQYGHVKGAWSIPLASLLQRLDDLPRDKELIVYCRGRYCVFADEAVTILRQHGFRARRLSEGFPDWKIAGFLVGAEKGRKGVNP